MKVILWMAMSADGVVATRDGQEEFLSADNWIEFSGTCRKVGCLTWGRKTYEVVMTWPEEYLKSLDGVTKIVVSSQRDLALDPRFLLANSPEEALKIAENKGFSEVILSGGPTNNSAFMSRGLVDEMILNIEHVLVGTGKSLFASAEFMKKLTLLEFKHIGNTITQFRYKVE